MRPQVPIRPPHAQIIREPPTLRVPSATWPGTRKIPEPAGARQHEVGGGASPRSSPTDGSVQHQACDGEGAQQVAARRRSVGRLVRVVRFGRVRVRVVVRPRPWCFHSVWVERMGAGHCGVAASGEGEEVICRERRRGSTALDISPLNPGGFACRQRSWTYRDIVFGGTKAAGEECILTQTRTDGFGTAPGWNQRFQGHP